MFDKPTRTRTHCCESRDDTHSRHAGASSIYCGPLHRLSQYTVGAEQAARVFCGKRQDPFVYTPNSRQASNTARTFSNGTSGAISPWPIKPPS